MAKLFPGLTIVMALIATFFGFQSKTLVEKLQEFSKKEHQDLLDTKSKLKKTEDKLKTTEEELAMTKAEWEKTKETLRTTEAELTTKKGELESTKTMLADKDKELADLKDKIAKMVPPGANPDDLAKQLAAMQATKAELEGKVATLEKEKAELTTTVETLTARGKELEARIAPLNAQIRKYKEGIMIPGIRGRVLAVNAGWGFCVLSVGDKQGAAANRILVVARGGQAIGKVKITSVETSQSVADIIPSSFARGMYVQPGDDVIYTGDDRVKVEEPEGAVAPGVGITPAPLPELPRP